MCLLPIAYLPTCLFAYLPTCLLPTCLSAYLPICLFAYCLFPTCLVKKKPQPICFGRFGNL
ncbi:MAG TPA: hypothetical protein ENH84_07795 [Phycisphaerae bacterium]|nr:hypothetical protein [Phycisphaerae bacterium]